MLILNAGDIRAVTDLDQLIDALELAFQEVSSGEAVMPVRHALHIPGEEGDLLVMPAFLPRSSALATKIVSLYPANPARGLPFVAGVVVLNNAVTGVPEAVMDGGAITALRTGCASAVAVRLLARPDASILAIVGAGVQARSHLQAICRVRSVRQVRIASRTAERASQLAEEAQAWTEAPIRVCESAQEAVRGAEIIATTTTSAAPVVNGEWLEQGAHVSAVGAFGPTMRELDTEVIRRAAVVAVDTRMGCLQEAEDIRAPIQDGVFREADVAELGEILLGTRRNRADPAEITVYKSVGMAAMDAAAAALAVRIARELGVGTEVEL